ncbi:hypothetical protein J2Y45_000418 [Dyadobacter sp. BE34]|uniref:Uncharacterized protein n=1 Tax=Dyadobacter fermentans TaxID=94254 RepID=A0ABU1QPS0_9BACT|nr:MULTISPECIES: hypothetical protein [Dyadobacter]MDR6803148.1 hypothetical protein [Dyadobacter fermentans]MDR7195292.1 hypothetical protein [Dyadobacter sp. BE34]MDR7214162.1 hypothetical protein [Dyadobacter sp. BE31]
MLNIDTIQLATGKLAIDKVTAAEIRPFEPAMPEHAVKKLALAKI